MPPPPCGCVWGCVGAVEGMVGARGGGEVKVERQGPLSPHGGGATPPRRSPPPSPPLGAAWPGGVPDGDRGVPRGGDDELRPHRPPGRCGPPSRHLGPSARPTGDGPPEARLLDSHGGTARWAGGLNGSTSVGRFWSIWPAPDLSPWPNASERYVRSPSATPPSSLRWCRPGADAHDAVRVGEVRAGWIQCHRPPQPARGALPPNTAPTPRGPAPHPPTVPPPNRLDAGRRAPSRRRADCGNVGP